MSVNFDDTKITFRSKSPRELQLSNFIFSIINKPFVVSMGTAIIKWALYFKLPIKWLIKATLFDQFCGGESIQGCKKKINQLKKERSLVRSVQQVALLVPTYTGA